MNAIRAACSCCCVVVPVVVGDIDIVSGGLPKMMGANEDATDDGTPAEAITLTMDELNPSDPGKAVNENDGVV